MTAIPDVTAPRRDGFAVVPVVEYEPESQSLPGSARRSSHVVLRRRISTAPRPGPGSQPEAVGDVLAPPMREVAVFADAALRRVLEVIDRRRPPAQLRPLLAPSLVDSVLSVGRTARESAAVLRRLRVQPAGHPDPTSAAEVFGSYSRGNRVHAIACRVERVRDAKTNRWLLVALHIG